MTGMKPKTPRVIAVEKSPKKMYRPHVKAGDIVRVIQPDFFLNNFLLKQGEATQVDENRVYVKFPEASRVMFYHADLEVIKR